MIPTLYSDNLEVMPGGKAVKQYLEGGYYHIYNRGTEKRLIFLDEQDQNVFLSYLKDYLLPRDDKALYNKLSNPQTSYKEKDKILKLLRLNNFADEITLLAYCLMPNHFHLFVQQKSAGSIDKFMNSLGTRYTIYFNKKYKRVGALCQGVYKAVLVNTDEQVLHLSRYIHQQALVANNQPSSYLDYIGLTSTNWVHPEEILAFFSKNIPNLSYKAFVEQRDDLSIIYNLAIDIDD